MSRWTFGRPAGSAARRRRRIAAVLVAALVASGLTGQARGDAALPAGGMSATDLNSAFASYGDTGGQWTGGDSTVSAPLPDGRSVWLFSDTFLGTVNADHSRPRNSPFIHNSMVVQDGSGLVSTRYGGTAAAPTSLVPENAAGDEYWAGAARVEGGALKALYLRMHITGTGPFDFTLMGTSLVTFTLPGLAVQSVVDLPLGSTVAWGSAMVDDGGYTYVYGAEFVAADSMRFAHLARVPAGGLAGAWQFWTGSGWSASESDSARMISGVGTGYGVQKVGSQFVLITQENNLIFSPNIVAYTAPAPTGPFTGPILLMTAPEAPPGSANIVYDTHFHPELARSGKLLFSYNVNSLATDGNYLDARTYRPRFVEVDWPRPVIDPATLPGSPTGLAMTSSNDGVVHLSWQAPPGSGLRYWVYQTDVTAGQTFPARWPSAVDTTSYDVGMLRDGHTYRFAVSAANTAGEGPPSADVTVTVHVVALPAPAGAAATANGDGTVTVSWQAVTGAWSYDIYRRDVTAGDTAFTRTGTAAGDATSASLSGLQQDHQYEIYVVADNGAGASDPSAHVTATAHTSAPGTVTGLTATSDADGTIALNWTAPGAGLWFNVYQRDVTKGETTFTKLPLPITTCCAMTAGYLLNNDTYEFKVAATNIGGEGPASATAQATSHYPLPPVPTGLTATANDDGTIALSWNPPANGLWYNVYQRDVTNGDTSFTQLPYPVTSGTTMTAGYLTIGHAYEFKVTSLSQGGESAASATARATARLAAPAAPSGLTATANTDGTVTLRWSAPGPNLWYLVYQRDVTDGDTNFTQLPLPVTSGTTMTAGYLTVGHTYEFEVTATNAGGESPPSNVASAKSTIPPPAAPTGLTARANGDGTITLNWTAPAPNLWYLVYQKDVTAGDATFTQLPLPVTSGTTMTAGYLTVGHTYAYKVTATNAGGESPASGEVQAVPHVDPPAAPANLRGRSTGDGNITLDWDAPAPGLYYFVYYRDVTAGASFTKAVYPTDKTTITWGPWPDGHVMEFKVTGSNAGGEGPASGTVQVTSHGGLPAAPTGLTATAGDGQVQLTWNASATPNVWYLVFQRDATTGQSWQQMPYPVTTCCGFTAGYLADGDTYEFKVEATTATGDSGPSNVASARPLPPLPQAPANLVASAGDGQVTLNFTASTTANVWYLVSVRDATANGSWQQLPLPLTTCCAFTAGYLIDGHTYEFRVAATNLAGNSAWSNVASARPMPPAPQPPTGLTGSAGDGTVHLSWNASPTPGVWYFVEMRDVTAGGAWTRLAWPLPGTTSWDGGWLVNGHTYGFRVVSTNLSGVSAPTPELDLRPFPPFPQKPVNLRVDTVGDGHVLIRWDPSPTPNVYYQVIISGCSTGNSMVVLPLPVIGQTWLDVGYLWNNCPYQFWVLATNLAGYNAAGPVTATPRAPAPQPPSNLSVTSIQGGLMLAYQASPTPNVGYMIYYRDSTTGQQAWTPGLGWAIASTHWTISGWFDDYHCYDLKVVAVNSTASSAPLYGSGCPMETKAEIVNDLTQFNDHSYGLWLAGHNAWYYGSPDPYGPYQLDWTTDYCSNSPDRPGFDFKLPCARHDFGYRNHKALGDFSTAKPYIDFLLLLDLLQVCDRTYPTSNPWNWTDHFVCTNLAWTYYAAARQFG